MSPLAIPYKKRARYQSASGNHAKLFVDGVFESFASLESRNSSLLDFDGFAGARILAVASFAYPSFEGTEANQLNLVFLSNGFFNGINKCVYSLFCVFLGIAVLDATSEINSLLFISKSSSILIAPFGALATVMVSQTV